MEREQHRRIVRDQSRSVRGFHGDTGYAVSWRPIDQSWSAASIGGSPFETLAEAKETCNAMAAILTRLDQFRCESRSSQMAFTRSERRSAATDYIF
jgi:hypothetical protein